MSALERDPGDPVLDELIARASRTQQPAPHFADHVMGALRARALVRGEHPSRRWLLAATWFLAGVGAGTSWHYHFKTTATPSGVAVVAHLPSDRLPRDPEVWY